jgi:hypothetical protein
VDRKTGLSPEGYGRQGGGPRYLLSAIALTLFFFGWRVRR